jgi:hypothetical protein
VNSLSYIPSSLSYALPVGPMETEIDSYFFSYFTFFLSFNPFFLFTVFYLAWSFIFLGSSWCNVSIIHSTHPCKIAQWWNRFRTSLNKVPKANCLNNSLETMTPKEKWQSLPFEPYSRESIDSRTYEIYCYVLIRNRVPGMKLYIETSL